MKSYVSKIKSLEKKVHAKAIKLSDIERDYKNLRKEYQTYCEMEVNRKYKIGQILVYEVNEQYRGYYKTIFAFGGTSKSSVMKYGYIDFPSNCSSRHGNAPICSACDYEHIRLATKDEINEFKTKVKENGLQRDIEFYNNILD